MRRRQVRCISAGKGTRRSLCGRPMGPFAFPIQNLEQARQLKQSDRTVACLACLRTCGQPKEER